MLLPGGAPLVPVNEPKWGRSVYFKLPILLPAEDVGHRDFMVNAIAAENVSCRIPHRPLYEIPWLVSYLAEKGRMRSATDCPVTAHTFTRMIEVETGPHLPADAAAASASAVHKVWQAIEARER
jgi:dTDP-4-amino-4,6-dideoxygalactose transaminase